MRKLFIVAAMALGLVAVGCDTDFTPSTELSTAFYDAYPNAVDVEWEWKHNRKFKVAEFKLGGKECVWVLTEYEITYQELPAAVKTAFAEGYGETTPVDSVYYVERSNGDEIYTIESEVVVNGLITDIYLSYSPEGELLRNWVETENDDYIDYWLW